MIWARALGGSWTAAAVVAAAILLLSGQAGLANMSAAKSRVFAARTLIEIGRLDEVEDKLEEAEKFLAEESDADKAPVLKDIAAVRAELAAARGGGSGAGQAAPAPAAPASDFDPSKVKGQIMQARMRLERELPDEAEEKLKEAEKFLAGGTAAETAALRDEIREVRALIQGQTAAQPSQPAQAPSPPAANPPAQASTADIPAARSRVMFARTSLEREQYDEAEEKLQQAEKYLEGGSPAETAPLTEEIKAIRAEIASAVSAQYAKTIGFAREKLEKAKGLRQQGMEPFVANMLEDAVDLLKDVPDVAKAEVMAEIEAFRGAGPKPMSDEARNIHDRIVGHIRNAEEILERDPRNAEQDLKIAADRLADAKAQGKLDGDTLQALEARLADARAKLVASGKNEALGRADDQLKRLEEQLATDPYGDADQSQANRVFGEMEVLVKRARARVEPLPQDDPDVRAMQARIEALDQKRLAAGAAWGKRQDLADIASRWQYYRSAFEGWEQETPEPPGGIGLRPWKMTKTGAAIHEIHYWMHDKDASELVEQYKDEDAVRQIREEAAATLEGAAAKLSEAFNRSLEEAEKRPLPDSDYDLAEPLKMAEEAKDYFAETRYLDANVARASKLDEKWKAEIAAIEARIAADLERMTSEANAAWPKIDASIKARDDFQPEKAESFVGQKIRLKGVRNRTGWDFDGQYAFAMWFNNVPLAGYYTPKVLAAMQAAREKVRRVDDHIDWDVIATVDGTCTIQRRVTTEVIDQRTRDVIGKIEGHQPMPCVKLTVVALHAGPVAVGP